MFSRAQAPCRLALQHRQVWQLHETQQPVWIRLMVRVLRYRGAGAQGGGMGAWPMELCSPGSNQGLFDRRLDLTIYFVHDLCLVS